MCKITLSCWLPCYEVMYYLVWQDTSHPCHVDCPAITRSCTTLCGRIPVTLSCWLPCYIKGLVCVYVCVYVCVCVREGGRGGREGERDRERERGREGGRGRREGERERERELLFNYRCLCKHLLCHMCGSWCAFSIGCHVKTLVCGSFYLLLCTARQISVSIRTGTINIPILMVLRHITWRERCPCSGRCWVLFCRWVPCECRWRSEGWGALFCIWWCPDCQGEENNKKPHNNFTENQTGTTICMEDCYVLGSAVKFCAVSTKVLWVRISTQALRSNSVQSLQKSFGWESTHKGVNPLGPRPAAALSLRNPMWRDPSIQF